MAQYSNDFSQYTLQQFPSDWTPYAGGTTAHAWVNEDGLGESYLRIDNIGSTLRRFFIWDAIPATSGTIEAYFECEGVTVPGRDCRVVLFMDPLTNTDATTDTNAVLAGIFPQGGTMYATEYSDGSAVGSTATTAYTYEAYTRYSVLVNVSGTTLTIKVWETGTQEPASPQHTETLNETYPAGLIGLGAFEVGGMDYVYFFGVGTEGDPAPRTMLSGATVTLDQITLFPGSTISGTYSGHQTVPTSPIVLMDKEGNTMSVAVNITDNGDGTGSFSGTMPSEPTASPAQNLLYGPITGELN